LPNRSRTAIVIEMARTKTSAFGVSKREAHDSSAFYARNLYAAKERKPEKPTKRTTMPVATDWCDRIYCGSSERMPIPDASVGLAFTSPPYNVGKEYEGDLGLREYLGLIERVGREVYRVLKPGGRYVVNIANLGRKPYLPMHAHFYAVHTRIGFLPMGEIIWQKAEGANSSCAWGSWRSAKAPRIRDVHEYLLVFARDDFSRPDEGRSDVGKEEFLRATLSVWKIPPESAKRVGHPAPFPLALAERVIRLYSYRGDVVLDPFCGSGTTLVAAKKLGRHYVGFEVIKEYVLLARKRLAN
jgi:DNA modification methylase